MINFSPMRMLYRPFQWLFPRLDHWILLRFPLFWRTRFLDFIFALATVGIIVAILSYLVFGNMYIIAMWGSSLNFIIEFWGIMNWTFATFMFLYAWLICIIIVRMGEIPLRWHFTTMYSTIIGAYVCVIVLSILPFSVMRAIKYISISDDDLAADIEIVKAHDRWRCVPENTLDNSDEIKDLQSVLSRYRQVITPERSRTKRSDTYCDASEFPLKYADVVGNLYYGLNLIQDYRKMDADAKSERNYNIFRGFGIKVYGWPIIVAVLFGLISTAGSYPMFVWRRIILRR